MKKKLTNAAADLALVTLTQIAKSKTDIPVRAGFRILQNIRSLEPVVNLYRSENDRLIREASGGSEKFERDQDPEAFDRCREQLKELAAIEIEVEIAEVDAEDIADVKLPIRSMLVLEIMTKASAGEEGDEDNG